MAVQLTTVEVSEKTLRDLDIFDLLRPLFPGWKNADQDIAAFVSTYLTHDPQEIHRRVSVLGHLKSNPQNTSHMADLAAQNQKLSTSLKNLRLQLRPIAFATQTRLALEAYVSSVGGMEDLFTPPHPAIQDICQYIEVEKSGDFYHSASHLLTQLQQTLPPLHNVTLGVNLCGAGRPTHVGIAEINSPQVSVGIFDNAGHGNGLTSPLPVKSQSQFSHFSDFIFTEVEKQWAPQLKPILSLLRKFPFERLVAWHEWLSHMELYCKGLSFANRFTDMGYPLCAPIAHNQFQAEEMIYPNFAIQGHVPLPQSLTISHGDTVMVTGANGSGKTSGVKTFAQNSLLAQLGFWVPAKSFTFIPFSHWYAVFPEVDNNTMEASRHQKELEQIHTAIQGASAGSCIILNEPYTATSHAQALLGIHDTVKTLVGKGATTILITHMCDLYNHLLDSGVTLRSYVTHTTICQGKAVKTFALEARPPDTSSLARYLAETHGFGIAHMVPDLDKVRILEDFIAEGDSR